MYVHILSKVGFLLWKHAVLVLLNTEHVSDRALPDTEKAETVGLRISRIERRRMELKMREEEEEDTTVKSMT